uniref:Uncharacterized protein n=1 Tax=Compsopogon caeruleus TaxID=31354 RepID=A0A7S1XFN7_9RHOD|mmetsp:Transcript_6859/g.14105  ORF Transcript_6859/g.14105 Transcript_6859/m.14105 type:complete len:116 (+) Transcript_6859:110-457(+)
MREFEKCTDLLSRLEPYAMQISKTELRRMLFSILPPNADNWSVVLKLLIVFKEKFHISAPDSIWNRVSMTVKSREKLKSVGLLSINSEESDRSTESLRMILDTLSFPSRTDGPRR